MKRIKHVANGNVTHSLEFRVKIFGETAAMEALNYSDTNNNDDEVNK